MALYTAARPTCSVGRAIKCVALHRVVRNRNREDQRSLSATATVATLPRLANRDHIAALPSFIGHEVDIYIPDLGKVLVELPVNVRRYIVRIQPLKALC